MTRLHGEAVCQNMLWLLSYLQKYCLGRWAELRIVVAASITDSIGAVRLCGTDK